MNELPSNQLCGPVWTALGCGKPVPSQAKHTASAQSARSDARPNPLGESGGRLAKFPVHALGKHGAAMVEALHYKFQAPIALCGQSVLASMGTAVSAWGQVEAIHGGGMPLSLFMIAAAQSGERKTAIDQQTQLGISVLQKELRAEREALKQELSESGNCDELPGSQIIINEPTYEGLLKTMAEGPGFAVLSNDDAASFFGGHSMSREQKQKTTAGLSQLWSGSHVYSPRADGRNAGVEDVPLTICLMFQPYLISQVFGDREMVEQGFLARVLPCFPRTTMGTRFFRESPRDVEAQIVSFAKHVHTTLRNVQGHRELFTPTKDIFAPQLPTLSLSKAAKQVLIKFHDEVEAKLAPGGEFAKVCGFAGRSTENATRISGVVTLFDDVNASEVSGQAALSACELMRFYIDEFSYFVSLAKSQKDDSAAAELGAWIARHSGAGGVIHDKEISQYGPPAFRKKGHRQSALNTLVGNLWLERLPKGTVVDGVKRAEVFRVNERISEVL